MIKPDFPKLKEEGSTPELYVKDKYLQMIEKGTKTLEIRLKSEKVGEIKIGQTLLLSSSSRRVLVLVKAIREYKSIDQLLNTENPNAILPGTDKRKLKELWQKNFTQTDQNICVIEIEKIDI